MTERVATLLLGAPSGHHPDKGKVQFNDVFVDLVSGRFYDMEEETGGDHLELIRRIKRVENGKAEAWLEENVTKATKTQLAPEFETERLLIGLLAMQPRLMAAIQEDVTADHFALPEHKLVFECILDFSVLTDGSQPMPLAQLLAGWGGDPLAPVMGADGFNAAQYISQLIARAPDAPDAAHVARTLAQRVRSDANRGEIDDDGDIDPDPEPFVSKFGGIPFELLDEPGPEHEHLIDGILTVGDKSVIGGASRSGKSFLAIDMAMSIATATDFFGHKVMRPGLVVYQAGEGGRGIKKRFRAWRQYHQLKKEDRVPVFILTSRIDIHSADGDTAKLIDELSAIERMYNLPIVATFIDTLAKASGAADENSGRDMGVVMGNVDKLADAFPEMHVCLVHHMNAGGTKLRGHTSVHAGVDQVILVTRDEDNPRIRTALLDKQKDEEDGAKIVFELPQITIGYREIDGKPITSCIPIPLGGPFNTAAARKTLMFSDDQTNIFDSLKKALAENGIATPPELRLPKSIATVCKVTDWYNAYRAVTSKEDGAIRQAMSRASDKFVKLRVIGRINPYVWVTGRAVAGRKDGLEGDASQATPQQEFPEV